MSLNHIIVGGRKDINLDVAGLQINGLGVAGSNEVLLATPVPTFTSYVGDVPVLTSTDPIFGSRVVDSISMSGGYVITTNATNTGKSFTVNLTLPDDIASAGDPGGSVVCTGVSTTGRTYIGVGKANDNILSFTVHAADNAAIGVQEITLSWVTTYVSNPGV